MPRSAAEEEKMSEKEKNGLNYVKFDPQEYSFNSPDYEICERREGNLGRCPSDLAWCQDGVGVRARSTSGGTYVQKNSGPPDYKPVGPILVYRRKETVCYQCHGALPEMPLEVKHFHNWTHNGSECLRHKVCSSACEEAFIASEEARFDEDNNWPDEDPT